MTSRKDFRLGEGITLKGGFFQDAQIRKGLCSRSLDFFETASGAFLFGTSHSRIMFHSMLVFQVYPLSFRTFCPPEEFHIHESLLFIPSFQTDHH